MKLIVPDNNDPELIEVLENLKKKKYKHSISSIYGKPTSSNYFGSGRANIHFQNITNQKATERVLKFQDIKIEYEYALNGMIPKARILQNRKHIIEEMEWLESSPIQKLVTSNYEIAKLVQIYAPSLKLVISTFAGIDNIKKIEQWSQFNNVNMIVPDRSTYRNLNLLEKLVQRAKDFDISTSVVANLGCMTNCIRTEEHAIIKDMASENRDILHYAPCSFYCLKFLLKNPNEFIKLPIIRPEELDILENIGVQYVKLVDRTQTTDWIKNVVKHYLSGSYNGNILELTCNFTKEGVEKLSNDDVSKLDISKIIKSREEIIHYRKILPELMDVSIDNDFSFLQCGIDCSICDTKCSYSSTVRFDPIRKEIVLKQLEQLENEYFFK